MIEYSDPITWPECATAAPFIGARCTRLAGHPGDHHGPIPDTPYTITWNTPRQRRHTPRRSPLSLAREALRRWLRNGNGEGHGKVTAP